MLSGDFNVMFNLNIFTRNDGITFQLWEIAGNVRQIEIALESEKMTSKFKIPYMHCLYEKPLLLNKKTDTVEN